MKKILAVSTGSGKVLITILMLSGIFISGCYTNQAVKSSTGPIPPTRSLQQQTVNAQSLSYIFQIGDQLRITIRGYSELDTSFTIGGSGVFSLRLIGEIQAAGVTRAQLIDEITGKLGKYVKTEVHPSIDVLNIETEKVIVLGAVFRPENYAVAGEVTVFQALAMAGGTTPEADLEHAKIFRNGEAQNVQEVDLVKYMAKESGKDMPMVKPGDMVYIPQEENILRELSNFFRDSFFLFTLFTISN